MLNVESTGLLHRHGDHWSPMLEVEANSPAALDPERKMLRGYRVFRCRDCDDEVSVETPEARQAIEGSGSGR